MQDNNVTLKERRGFVNEGNHAHISGALSRASNRVKWSTRRRRESFFSPEYPGNTCALIAETGYSYLHSSLGAGANGFFSNRRELAMYHMA